MTTANPGIGTVLACAAVLFDCDGVLVDSDASVERAWTAWAHRFGLDPAVVLDTVHGRRAADTVGLLIDPDQRAAAGLLIDTYEVDDAATVAAIPGSVELTRSIPPQFWAVVTSGISQLARARLSAAGHRIPAVTVTAEDVEFGKPAPDGYLNAASQLGAPIAACVVLEDSTSGAAAARAAGVAAVLGVGHRALETDADLVVADLTAVRWVTGGLHVGAGGVLRDYRPPPPTAGAIGA